MNRLAAAAAVGMFLVIASAAAQQKTVLDGVYTTAQADRGAAVYDVQCAGCHDGADVDGPPLTGSPFVDRWREDTVASLFDFVKTQMPQRSPGSLTEAQYLDIVAHLLHENDYPAGKQELTVDTANTTMIVGPDGPRPLPSGALVGVIGCLTQNAAREWTVTRATDAARVRVGDEVTAAEATAAAAVTPGTQTFALQNVGDGGTALPGAGHKVLIKGALNQRAAGARIHVTAAKSVAATCG